METFDKIYLFTTENIAGYMKNLDLTNKKIITVAASGDQLLNAILLGATDITCFDINPLSKKYIDLKLAAIKYLSFDEFKKFLLIENCQNFNYEIIKNLNMNLSSKNFWLKKLQTYNKNGLLLRNSNLFNTKYFDYYDKIKQNIYLKKKNYDIIRNKLSSINIKFIESDVVDLKLEEEYDYMFLSNIADYLKNMYTDNYLENFKKLIDKFKRKVKFIYFAYVYEIDNSNKRSIIDDTDIVKKMFNNMKLKKFKTAFVNSKKNVKDAVYIIEGDI